jgi:hypothetical protein
MSWVVAMVLVLLVGCIFFSPRLLCLALAQSRKTSCDPTRDGRCHAYILAGYKGNGDNDLLWHTRVHAREFLRSAGSTGASTTQMKALYREFPRAYPEPCDGSSFSDWLNTLRSRAVAVHKG